MKQMEATLERKYEEERNEYMRLKEEFTKEAQNLSQMYLISKSWLEKWKKSIRL
jgi:hypothetical protein